MATTFQDPLMTTIGGFVQSTPKKDFEKAYPGLTKLFGGAGKVPTNAQILEYLEVVRRVLHEQRQENQYLDEKGRLLALALERFIYTTENVIQEKNPDQAIQHFAGRVVSFAERVKKEAQFKEGQLKESLNRLSNVANNLKRLFIHLFTSNELRSMMIDGTDMFSALEDIAKETKSLKEEGKEKKIEPSDISDESKNKLVSKATSILSKIGSKQEFKETRQDFLSLFDFWSAEKSRSQPTLKYQQPEMEIFSSQNQQPTTTTSESQSLTGSSSDLTTFQEKQIPTINFQEVRGENQMYQALTDEFKRLHDDAISILQRFSQRSNFSSLENEFWALYKDIKADAESTKFFTDLRRFGDAIVNKPEISNRQDVLDEGKRLLDQAIIVYRKYGDRATSLISEVKLALKSLQEERYLSEYKEEIKNVKDAVSGSIIDTLAQFRHLAFPVIKEMMQEIKLPRIENRDNLGFVAIDNLVLRSREVVMDDVYLQFKSGMKDLLKAELKIKNIDALFKNVNFSYQRTSKFPTISDQGVFNCHVKSPHWKLKWVVREDKGKAPFFELIEVKGEIKKLRIEIISSKHKWLETIALPLVNSVLRKRAQAAVEDSLRQNGEFISNKLNDFFSTYSITSTTSTSLLPEQLFPTFSLLSPDTPQPIESRPGSFSTM
jgi:hypothetical protein